MLPLMRGPGKFADFALPPATTVLSDEVRTLYLIRMQSGVRSLEAVRSQLFVDNVQFGLYFSAIDGEYINGE